MSDAIPDDAYILIIGAMKCGTTSLYSYLADHPEICPAADKEPEFFSRNQAHGMAVDTYNDLWEFDQNIHRYAIEASTGYTKLPFEPGVAQRIHQSGIKPKFIYIIRDPFERIESNFNYSRNTRPRLKINDPEILAISNYFVQLEQYKNYFPLSSILIVDFDGLKNTPRAALGQVYEFLGLSANQDALTYDVKNQTYVNSDIEYNLKKIGLHHLLRHAPTPLKHFGKSLFQRISPSKRRKLTASERQQVYDELRHDMTRLSQTYGVDVRKWGFEA